MSGSCRLTEAKVTVPPEVEKLTTAWASDGKTVLYAVAQGRLLGAFAVEDEIRPVSSEAVTELPQLGIGVQFAEGYVGMSRQAGRSSQQDDAMCTRSSNHAAGRGCPEGQRPS